jgi:hypothetical protein
MFASYEMKVLEVARLYIRKYQAKADGEQNYRE